MRTAVFWLDLREDFAREAGATANIEDEGGIFEVEEFESAVGHGGLDVLDTRGGGVLARFGVIVVQVRRATIRQLSFSKGIVGETYRVSSGRDMMAAISLP
jgi:hypothetical protein